MNHSTLSWRDTGPTIGKWPGQPCMQGRLTVRGRYLMLFNFRSRYVSRFSFWFKKKKGGLIFAGVSNAVSGQEDGKYSCTTTFNLFYSSNCFVYFLTVQATCGLFSYYLELCSFTSKSYTKYHVTMIQLLTPKQTRAGESAGACVVFRYHSCLWTQHCQYNYLLIIFFRLSFHCQISGLEKKKN